MEEQGVERLFPDCDCQYDEYCGACAPELDDSIPEIGEFGWNDDPAWIRYIGRFEESIKAITAKFTQDEALRDDCAQEARIELCKMFPEQVKGYEKFVNGEYTEDEWNANLDRYCRNVIRNTVLSVLDSLKSGPWYHGRTRRAPRKNKDGTRKYRIPARYVRLEDLTSTGMVQIDEQGTVIWDASRGKEFDPGTQQTNWMNEWRRIAGGGEENE